jgi:hypothetical protein
MKGLHWKIGAITLLALPLIGETVVRAEEPTNPAAAVLSSHIMLIPADMKWGGCPPVLPPGAKCAMIEGDMKAANVLFAYRLKMPDNYRIPPHFHPADEHLQHTGEQADDGWKLHSHAERRASFCLDEGRNYPPSPRDWSVGAHLRESGGRSQEPKQPVYPLTSAPADAGKRGGVPEARVAARLI